jgi:hypothetical protein
MDLTASAKIWDILNKHVEPRKYDIVLINSKILRSYNLSHFKLDNNFIIGIVLSNFFLNDFCEKMYKLYICNTIINIRYDHIQEIIID